VHRFVGHWLLDSTLKGGYSSNLSNLIVFSHFPLHSIPLSGITDCPVFPLLPYRETLFCASSDVMCPSLTKSTREIIIIISSSSREFYIPHVSRQFEGSRCCSVMVCIIQIRPVTCCLQAHLHCVP